MPAYSVYVVEHSFISVYKSLLRDMHRQSWTHRQLMAELGCRDRNTVPPGALSLQHYDFQGTKS